MRTPAVMSLVIVLFLSLLSSFSYQGNEDNKDDTSSPVFINKQNNNYQEQLHYQQQQQKQQIIPEAWAGTFSGPNGQIAFSSTKDGNWEASSGSGSGITNELYVINPDGSGESRLTNNDVDDTDPTWSPDGTKIAFERDAPLTFQRFEWGGENYGKGEIYLINPDGSGETRLTNNDVDDSNPAWSPDGTEIAIIRDGPGVNREIYVISADGSREIRLTNNDVDDTDPTWSPDGTAIAFSSNSDGRGGSSNKKAIYVINTAGELRRLTNNDANDPFAYNSEQPTWSPDGTAIAFSSGEIYVVNAADGSERRPLTNTGGINMSPTWSPDGTKIAFVSSGALPSSDTSPSFAPPSSSSDTITGPPPPPSSGAPPSSSDTSPSFAPPPSSSDGW